ncbi:hypothetical protein P7C73_g4242, partial [Tremellales sp. Uapishka_1]
MLALTKLFGLLAVLGVISAAPAQVARGITKRDLPFFGGVNLAGCDFGMSTDGSSGTSQCPGTTQVAHFVKDGANIFRLPVGWQYLVDNDETSQTLDATFFATYDALVQSVLSQGAYAIIDIHNYARWDGAIIGQGGPSNEDFASLWTLLATKYAGDSKVIFGIMNEPHDVDITLWAGTVQAVVNAIRAAGATTQTILIPGNSYTNAQDWYNNVDTPLLSVTDPANSGTDLLLLEAHHYLDSDSSGTSAECTSNGVDVMTSLATWVKGQDRKVIITETGGGNTASCQTNLAQELAYIAGNTDAFAGFTVWAAGSFAQYPDYALSITPNGDVDNTLFIDAVKPYLPGSSSAASNVSSASVSASATSTASAISEFSSSSSAASALGSSSASTSLASSTLAGASTSSAALSLASVSTSSVASASHSPSSASETSVSYTTPSSSVAVTSVTDGSSSALTSSISASRPTTSSSLSVDPIATSSPSLSSSSSASAASATSTAFGQNLQTYPGALGGIVAPAVYASGSQWQTGGNTFNSLNDALNRSCDNQMNLCQAAANQSGNTGNFTVAACNGQLQSCMASISA